MSDFVLILTENQTQMWQYTDVVWMLHDMTVIKSVDILYIIHM